MANSISQTDMPSSIFLNYRMTRAHTYFWSDIFPRMEVRRFLNLNIIPTIVFILHFKLKYLYSVLLNQRVICLLYCRQKCSIYRRAINSQASIIKWSMALNFLNKLLMKPMLYMLIT